MANPKSVRVNGCALDTSVGNLARAAYRAFATGLERLTLPHGVSSAQWPLLRALWDEEGLTQRELARRVGIREPTMASALSKLEKAGFIRRLARKEDRRSRQVFLSTKGKRLKERLIPYVEAVNGIALANMVPEEIATARRVLIAMNRNLAEVSPVDVHLSDR